MSVAAAAGLAVVVLGLLAVAAGPELARKLRGRSRSGSSRPAPVAIADPGRELRAERRAEQLLRSAVGEEHWEMYRALGFLYAMAPGGGEEPGPYGYLIYPHRPIICFDARSGELLSELCVTFPDRSDPRLGERLPAADDVLAKWMALRGDERGLLARANMHFPGRQVDPDQARRDVARLSEWIHPGGDRLAA